MTDGFAADLEASMAEMRGRTAGFAEELAAATKQMREMDAESRRLSRSLGTSLRSAFDKAIFGGKGLGEVMRGLASDVVSKSLNAAITPVTTGLGSALTGVLGSAGGALASAIGFQNGGAFSSGRVRAFAKGGVVGGPTTFPMRGGTGLMGEAGPEAILPLSRGADGRLGVRAERGQGTRPVVVNIHTRDAESFRRSRGQVSAQLARAVARGNDRL